MTSFIAPVPLEDLAERESSLWRYPIIVGFTGPSTVGWRSISWTTQGEMLIDAVGGLVLPDAGYLSVANDEWRLRSHSIDNSSHRWMRWNGDWYRSTYYNDRGPLDIWRLNRAAGHLELTTTTSSAFDGGFSNRAIVSATPIWGETQWWFFDGLWNGLNRYLEANVTIAPSLSDIPTVPSIDGGLSLLSDGVDGDTGLIWTVDGTTLENPQTLVRFRGNDMTATVVDAGFCFTPYLKGAAPITMACASDGGLDVWVADRDGARIIGRDELPPQLREISYAPFLARVQPLRLLFQRPTDAGTSAMLNSCDSERCVELLEPFSAPLNAGVDDAGALYVADYILDAGVRVTRFAPGAW